MKLLTALLLVVVTEPWAIPQVWDAESYRFKSELLSQFSVRHSVAQPG